MGDTTKIPLVSSEISGIWDSYQAETLFRCIIKYFSNRVDDRETRDILQYALNLIDQRISVVSNLFNQEKLPLPEGFTDAEVDINAPRLFTDTLYLQYISYAARVAVRGYSMILNRIARYDLRDYFSRCITESIDLCNKSAELSLSKGIFIRSPHIEVPKKISFIKSENFMVEWFGKKRPLITDEITHIFSILNDTVVRRALVVGFGQVCKDKQVSDYIKKVLALSAEQNEEFISLLTDEGISIAGASDSYVTDSTISPFSDKLILNKILVMYRVKIGNLGVALADIMRSDLKTIFMKHLDDAMEYAKDATDILIDYGWLEQPPQAINHEVLIGV